MHPATRLVCVAGLLILLDGCTRKEASPPPQQPTPTEKTTDPPGKPGTGKLISVHRPGKGSKRARSAKPEAGPEGPSKVKSTSPEIYLGNLEARGRVLTKRLEERPDDHRSLAALASWHMEKENLDGDLQHALDADALLTKAIGLADGPGLRKQRAGVRGHLHRFGDARADLDAALKAKPDDPGLRRALGWMLHNLGQDAEARPLLETPSKQPAGWQQLGRQAVLLFKAGKVEEADLRLRLAHGAYRAVSPIPLAWIDLQRGLLRLRTGRYEEAKTFFAAAYARLPQYYVVAEHLAEVEALLGNHEVALGLYDEVVKRTGLPEFMAARAGVLRDLKRADEAARAVRAADQRWRALVEKFGAPVAGHAVDFWLEDLPRPADARRWAEENLKLRRDPDSLVAAARARAAAGDAAGARTLLAEAEKAPLVVDEFYAGLADAWHRLGDAEASKRWLAKARALNPKTEAP